MLKWLAYDKIQSRVTELKKKTLTFIDHVDALKKAKT